MFYHATPAASVHVLLRILFPWNLLSSCRWMLHKTHNCAEHRRTRCWWTGQSSLDKWEWRWHSLTPAASERKICNLCHRAAVPLASTGKQPLESQWGDKLGTVPGWVSTMSRALSCLLRTWRSPVWTYSGSTAAPTWWHFLAFMFLFFFAHL